VIVRLSRAIGLVVALLTYAPAASAQATAQLWGNITLDWVKSDHLVYELDFEPKVLLSASQRRWRSVSARRLGVVHPDRRRS
jgi:hypothetical protein